MSNNAFLVIVFFFCLMVYCSVVCLLLQRKFIIMRTLISRHYDSWLMSICWNLNILIFYEITWARKVCLNHFFFYICFWSIEWSKVSLTMTFFFVSVLYRLNSCWRRRKAMLLLLAVILMRQQVFSICKVNLLNALVFYSWMWQMKAP